MMPLVTSYLQRLRPTENPSMTLLCCKKLERLSKIYLLGIFSYKFNTYLSEKHSFTATSFLLLVPYPVRSKVASTPIFFRVCAVYTVFVLIVVHVDPIRLLFVLGAAMILRMPCVCAFLKADRSPE